MRLPQHSGPAAHRDSADSLLVALPRAVVLRRLPPLACAGRWDVTEVTVVASTLGGTGSRYDVLDRVRLGP